MAAKGSKSTKSPKSKFAQVDGAAKAAGDSAQSFIIEQPKRALLAFEITFDTPVIQNCFNQKALEDMLRKHMGLTVIREKKVPRDCIERAKVKNVEGSICTPTTAYKKGMLTARSLVKGITRTQLQTQVFVCGNSVPLVYKEMVPRMDMVRTSGIQRTPDIRFRPEFRECTARLVIEYPPFDFKGQTVIDLLNRAGSVGVGEWRPEKNGIYGRYHVSRLINEKKEIDEILKLCAPLVQPLIIPEWAMDAEIDTEMLRKIAYAEEHAEDDEAGNKSVKTRHLKDEELDATVEVEDEEDAAKAS
jgi:hypothetical protein